MYNINYIVCVVDSSQGLLVDQHHQLEGQRVVAHVHLLQQARDPKVGVKVASSKNVNMC